MKNKIDEFLILIKPIKSIDQSLISVETVQFNSIFYFTDKKQCSTKIIQWTEKYENQRPYFVEDTNMTPIILISGKYIAELHNEII